MGRRGASEGRSCSLSLDLGAACTVCSLCDDSLSCALMPCACLLRVCYISVTRKKESTPAIQLRG